MISNETLERLWHCKREIAAGEKLLEDMAEVRKREDERINTLSRTEPTLKDAFGRRRQLQLGIPSGENGHRIFDVAPQLAESIIRAHIANKTAELTEATEQARVELSIPGEK